MVSVFKEEGEDDRLPFEVREVDQVLDHAEAGRGREREIGRYGSQRERFGIGGRRDGGLLRRERQGERGADSCRQRERSEAHRVVPPYESPGEYTTAPPSSRAGRSV